MSEAAAMALCAAHKACAGFTYNSGDRGRARGEEEVLFKSLAENVAVAPGWHTVRKRADSGVDCRPGLRPPAPPPITFNVKVLREEPPVFQVDGFVSEKLCQAMVNSETSTPPSPILRVGVLLAVLQHHNGSEALDVPAVLARPIPCP
mmetsp:Transcript_23262/g.65215  ORF Transcript_23262/g.65215 Transcript_23262/m.65215 type:complete len:148 (-) Transcript_23262:1195-1638(-)